jgi:hypothetical protein
MLVFTGLSNICYYHGLMYTIEVFSVLPIKDLRNAKGETFTTPYALFYGKKPNLGSYRVFGCPVTAKKYTITITITIANRYCRATNNITSQRGTLGLRLGVPQNQ